MTGSKARIWPSHPINARQTALQWENVTSHNKGGLSTQRWTLPQRSFLLINAESHQPSVVTPSATASDKQPETHFFFSFIRAPIFTAPQHELWAVMSKSCNELIGRQPNGSPWPHSACVTTNQKGESAHTQHFQRPVLSGSTYLVRRLRYASLKS